MIDRARQNFNNQIMVLNLKSLKSDLTKAEKELASHMRNMKVPHSTADWDKYNDLNYRIIEAQVALKTFREEKQAEYGPRNKSLFDTTEKEEKRSLEMMKFVRQHMVQMHQSDNGYKKISSEIKNEVYNVTKEKLQQKDSKSSPGAAGDARMLAALDSQIEKTLAHNQKAFDRKCDWVHKRIADIKEAIPELNKLHDKAMKEPNGANLEKYMAKALEMEKKLADLRKEVDGEIKYLAQGNPQVPDIQRMEKQLAVIKHAIPFLADQKTEVMSKVMNLADQKVGHLKAFAKLEQSDGKQLWKDDQVKKMCKDLAVFAKGNEQLEKHIKTELKDFVLENQFGAALAKTEQKGSSVMANFKNMLSGIKGNKETSEPSQKQDNAADDSPDDAPTKRMN